MHSGFPPLPVLALDNADPITSLAWSPDGHLLAFSSKNGTINFWDKQTGSASLAPIQQGSSVPITSLAWSPDGRFLVISSENGTVNFWDRQTSSVFFDLFQQGNIFFITSLVWSPDGHLLGSISESDSILLWTTKDSSSSLAELLVAVSENPSLKRHIDLMGGGFNSQNGDSVADWLLNEPTLGDSIADLLQNKPTPYQQASFLHRQLSRSYAELAKGSVKPAATRLTMSPDGHLLALSKDRIIRLQDAKTGKLIRTLEGHTGVISCISFSPDNRFLVSKSVDGTVRLWDTNVWEEIKTLNESSGSSSNGLAFHPTLPILATLGQTDTVIRIWKLDLELILHDPSAASDAHHYTNAKVVLVGDSGVGKSGLGLVLAKQTWLSTESTHGRFVWTFDDSQVAVDNGRMETRETLLWDLAGQPGYRLIHQLHLNEVSVALVVFDGSSETNPFAGVHHWERALRIAQEKNPNEAALLKKILVAARIDRGGIGVSRARIDALKRELGFEEYFETSAKEGTGIEQLRAAITNAISWEQLPKVTSTVLFQNIKDFLIEQKKVGRLLSTAEDLYHIFLQLHPETLLEQFDTCIGRLESQGLIRRLSFGNLVLLQPELLDAYASALVNAVKEEPDGLGSIAEEKVLAGSFSIPKDERITNKEQERLLLIAMVEDLLSYEISLREPADDGSYLIFPSQSTRENVEMPDPEDKTTAFNFQGPVLNIYATLTVRLSHSGQFKKKELWRNAITYEASVGGTCGLLLRNIGEGRGELTLFFDKEASKQTRIQFEQYIYIHLQRRALPESIQRKPIFLCGNCGFVVTAQLLRLRKERNCESVDCPNCQTYISLHDTEEQLRIGPSPAVQAMDLAADKQRDLATAQTVIQGKVKTGDFDVFLCHNKLDKQMVKMIGEQLKDRGILPWLDEWELRPGLPWPRLLEEQIGKIKSAAVFVGKNGRGPWQQLELEAFLREFAKRGCPVIPVLLATAQRKPQLPIFLSGMTWVDFRQRVPDPIDRLIWGITGERSPSEL